MASNALPDFEDIFQYVVSEHPEKFYMADALAASADWSIRVGDKTLPIHRVVLSMWSSVLLDMSTADSKLVDPVPIDQDGDFKLVHVLAFVRCAYSFCDVAEGKVKFLLRNQVLPGFIKLCDKLGADILLDTVLGFVQKFDLDVRQAVVLRNAIPSEKAQVVAALKQPIIEYYKTFIESGDTTKIEQTINSVVGDDVDAMRIALATALVAGRRAKLQQDFSDADVEAIKKLPSATAYPDNRSSNTSYICNMEKFPQIIEQQVYMKPGEKVILMDKVKLGETCYDFQVDFIIEHVEGNKDLVCFLDVALLDPPMGGTEVECKIFPQYYSYTALKWFSTSLIGQKGVHTVKFSTAAPKQRFYLCPVGTAIRNCDYNGRFGWQIQIYR